MVFQILRTAQSGTDRKYRHHKNVPSVVKVRTEQPPQRKMDRMMRVLPFGERVHLRMRLAVFSRMIRRRRTPMSKMPFVGAGNFRDKKTSRTILAAPLATARCFSLEHDTLSDLLAPAERCA